MTKIIMIDLETLSTAANAAITSIGACVFVVDDGEAASVEDSFIVGIDPDYYDLNASFHVDPKTVAWWAKQSKAAQDSLKINQKQTLPLAMDEFRTWVERQGEFDCVMARPAHFDLPILQNAAKHSHGDADDLPWKHYQVRCLRTIDAMFPESSALARAQVYPELVAHRADHDCVRQALDAQFIAGAEGIFYASD